MDSDLDIQRKVIQWHWNHGNQDAKSITKTTGIPKSTVYRVISRIKSGEGIGRRPGTGRPSILQPVDRRRVAHLARNHPLWSAANIAAEAARRGSPSVSRNTVARSLAKSGYKKWRAESSPDLTEEHKRKRVQ